MMNTRIRSVRRNLKKSQAEFAECLGVGGNYIYMVESGKSPVTDNLVEKIVRIFNVNESWLRAGEGDMYRDIDGNQELSAFFANVMNDEPEDFRRRFISALSTFTDDQWDMFADFCEKLVGDK